MDLSELKAQRKAIYDQMCAINDSAAKAGRMSADDQTKYENLQADLDAKGKLISNSESLSRFEAEVRNQRDNSYRPGVTANGGERVKLRQRSVKNNDTAYLNAFDEYFIDRKVSNVLQTGVDADGGYLVPETYETEILKLQYNLDPMRRLATVRSSGSLANIPLQRSGVTFGWVDELGIYPSGSPTLGRVVLSAFKNGGMVFASEEEIQDAATDVGAFVAEVGAQAMTDLESPSFYTGNGAKKPLGIFSTTEVGGITVEGVTGGVSATPVITFDNFIDIQHKLKRSYRDRATWLLSDDMVKAVRKLKDSEGLYIWQPSVVVGQPDRILGRPVEVSDYVPSMAVSTKTIVFGDIKAYRIQDRLGMQVKRLDEKYADEGKIAWRFTKRVDARLTDANAIVTFTHGAAT
jgi:HK97 family phage major capsid protein